MSFVNREVEDNIRKIKEREFEWADKPVHYLAWQLKKKREKIITTIQEGNKEF